MSIAALRLTMPKQNLHISRDTTAMYRDVLVNQVLNVADFGSHFDKILANLHNLNRMPLNGDVRFNLTEALINQFLLFVHQVRAGDLVLTNRQRGELPDINREFAYAAKLLLRDAVPQSNEEMANFVYWALSALVEQLQDYSEQHRSQPGTLWAETHRLYQFAEARLLTDFQNNKPDNRDIESRYKQALLFQAAQPEHLNDDEQRLIEGYLRKWAFRGQLNRQESHDLNSHYFYIDLASTLGVQSSKDIQGSDNNESLRVLNPLPTIEQSRQHMQQLRNGTTADKIGFPKKSDNIDAFMALKKALVAWKQASSRRFERAPCSIEAHTALGLNAICSYLRSPQAVPASLVLSQTINNSKTGACVKIKQLLQTDELLSVGDVVMHYQNSETRGRLGLIRWLKRTGESIVFGLEFIIGNLEPVTVRVRDRVAEALLISTSDNDSLITHKGYCASNTSVRLKSSREGISIDARAQSLMQRGQHVDQIRLKRNQAV
jgi:hypothetical protein